MYGEDLAWIHHHGYGRFAHEAAPGLLGLLVEAGIDRGTVVDLGCGSGIWLQALSAAGYRAIGVEPAEAFLALAASVVPEAELVQATAYDFDLPACDAVTALGEVLSYCDGSGFAPPLPELFARVAAVLRPGGLFVFDLMVIGAGPPMHYRDWRAEADWAIGHEVREDPEAGLLTRDITTFRAVGDGYRRGGERHVLRISDPAQIAVELEAAGFDVRLTGAYGAMVLAPRRQGFIARRLPTAG